jgi:ABC-2 type transport system permease protein
MISLSLPGQSFLCAETKSNESGCQVPSNMKIDIPTTELQQTDTVQFTYDSQKRKSPALEELFDIIKYRDLIFQLVRRDIVARYKRSWLGIAWTMLQPLGMMLVLTIVFSQLFSSVEGYPAYLLGGLMPWIFFSQTTNAAIQQSVWGETLTRRIYVPYTAFPAASVGTGLVNLLLSLFPLFAMMLIVGRPIRLTILFLPIPIILLSAFALGVGLLLSGIAVRFPDIAEMYLIILQAWMYLTPIMYPADILPEAIRKYLLVLNPMYYLILLFRVPIYDGVMPSPALILASTVIAIVTLVAGWIYFSHQTDKFAYFS